MKDVRNRLGIHVTVKQFLIALYLAFVYCIVELFNFVDNLLPNRVKAWLDCFKTLPGSAYVKVEHMSTGTIKVLGAIIGGSKEIAIGFGTACGALVLCGMFSLSSLLRHRKRRGYFSE